MSMNKMNRKLKKELQLNGIHIGANSLILEH